MQSSDLEKQVNDLLTTKFEQPEFEQGIAGTVKNIFSKEMLVSAAGTSLSVQLGNVISNSLPLPAALPLGSASIIAGALMQKFGGNNTMLKNFSLGIIQGGLASILTPLVSKVVPAQFSQEVKTEKAQEELNPMMKGVMW